MSQRNKQRIARMILEEHRKFLADQKMPVDELAKRIVNQALELAMLVQREKGGSES